MKSGKFVTFLWSSLISFTLSLSAAMWLVTAFNLGVDISLLTVFCLLAALFCSLCYTLPLGAAPTILGALTLLHMWQSGALEDGVEAILNRLSRQYNNAYNWGIIRWGLRTADDMEPTIVTALCILAAITVMVTAWTICRKKSSIFPMLSILFVGACFVVNDTVPATGWIFVLLLTAILLLMTGPVRRQSLKAGNRLCLILAPFVVILLLVVFSLTPEKAYDRQEDAEQLLENILGSAEMQSMMGSDTITTGSKVDLTAVGYRSALENKVLEVKAPFSGVLYLRSSAMDVYTGTGWTVSDKADLYWPNDGLLDAGEVEITTRFSHQMLYMPYYTGYARMKDIAGGIPNEKNLTRYSFNYKVNPEKSSLIARGASIISKEKEMMKSFVTMDPEVRAWAEPLAAEITNLTDNIYNKAELIASYVRNSATYDLKTARMPFKSKDFAKWFLENSDTGYCVHFATTTAVLLQALDIPARYVTGYMTTVTEGEVIEVKSKQAHAWVDYWLPGFGWVVLESTPAALVPEVTEPTEAQPSAPDETLSTAPTEAAKPQQGNQNNTTKPSGQKDPDASDLEIPVVVILWVGVAALMLAAVFLQRSLRIKHRQNKLLGAAPNGQALLHWQECEALAALLKEAPPKSLLELAEKAKFSHHTLTNEELRAFSIYRSQAVNALKKRNLFLQIYYCLILAKY